VNAATADWKFAVRDARKVAGKALRASKYLFDIEAALIENGAHALVFRQVLAPPASQDQFKLMCPAYSKSTESSGSPTRNALDVAGCIEERLDRGVAGWVFRGQRPSRRELQTFLRVASTLIGQQQLSTARRRRLAAEQENDVIAGLVGNGWTRLPSSLIDTRAAVPERHFMHKTRFATSTTSESAQEVDIACGLKNSFVLAMECKSTNDETNSVKRVNDVLKKATAWKTHWGNFVMTAALLQGVIAPKDVQRLADAGVEVFWSHDLAAFHAWLAARVT
jgi:hypothetical protein